ncbi:MAG: glycosyltransferase [Candidatus Omnitrophota bacterium]|jgi:glycosyltransferase involved in cell wall biosynthesis
MKSVYNDYWETEIVLPVYNEEKILEKNTLHVKHLLEAYNFKFIISIVDNGSTDKTFEIAKNLAKSFPNIFAFRLSEKGRGGALKFRIVSSSCPLIGYMDIDLSTDPLNFLQLCEQLNHGYDIIIGSRLLPSSTVKRSLLRNVLSRTFSRIIRSFLNLPFLDYQCGFKLFKRDKIVTLLPLVKNNNWFFDTELIFHAYKQGLRIKEFAVNWEESKRKSKVNLIDTIFEDIKCIISLRKAKHSRIKRQ